MKQKQTWLHHWSLRCFPVPATLQRIALTVYMSAFTLEETVTLYLQVFQPFPTYNDAVEEEKGKRPDPPSCPYSAKARGEER